MGAVDANRASTLPAWLDAQAQFRADAVCLRQKIRGRWYAWSWRRAADEVSRLSAALTVLGLRRGDLLVLVGDPSVEALLLALAAQRLGGTALPWFPGASFDASATADSRRRFAVVQHSEQLERLLSPGLSGLPDAVVCIDTRGVPPGSGVTAICYESLASGASDSRPAATPVPGAEAAPDDAAFAFAAEPADGGASGPRLVSHKEALAGAARLLGSTPIDAGYQALVPRVLSPEVARSFVGAWLSAGFCLSFPERASTRDVDRHELAPSLVIGTAASFGRLRERVVENLPEPGSVPRRLVDWALAPSTQGLDEAFRATVGRALVRRPLRGVIGFSRVKLALIDGPSPEQRVSAFFSRLGVELRPLSGALASPRELEPPPGLLSTVPKEVS